MTITVDRTLELLEAEVTELGADFIYERPKGSRICLYVLNGQPSCLIARVLAKMGVPLEVLELMDQDGRTGRYDTGANCDSMINVADDFNITRAAAHLMLKAQQDQDNSYAYGDVLSAATAAANYFKQQYSEGVAVK
jgi:hypothetical protein